MDLIQQLRYEVGPLNVTSGYRCPQHPIEAAKQAPGSHSTGTAVDIAVSGSRALAVLSGALGLGFTGIGVKQKGPHAKRFIHLDRAPSQRPMLWSY